MITDLNKVNIMDQKDHNHPSDRNKLEVLKSVQIMKDQAKSTVNKPAQIFAAEVKNLSHDIRSRMPFEESAKRSLRNQRSSDYPQVYNSLRNLHIEGILFIIFIYFGIYFAISPDNIIRY